MGTAVTGATLTKLKAVATAKYPGTVERAMKLADGSYVVHVIQSGSKGEVHVLVSKDFKITGTQKGGPPGGGAPTVRLGPAERDELLLIPVVVLLKERLTAARAGWRFACRPSRPRDRAVRDPPARPV